MTETLLKVDNLTKHFARGSGLLGGASGGVVRAVEDVSFQVFKGETLGLVGESGSGKSTTGRLILRLLEATQGRVSFQGRDVFALSKPEMRQLRRQMQIVFQDPYGAFNPRMTVGQIIGEALLLRGIKGRDQGREVARFLDMVQMPSNIGGRYPHEFSGGQRQRIGIARALAVEPSFVVADEPVSALDVSTQAEIVNLLLDLQRDLNLTMLFISHDLSVVRVLCDRVAVLFGGRILELASGASLFQNPLQPYTQELLAAVPIPDPARAKRKPFSAPQAAPLSTDVNIETAPPDAKPAEAAQSDVGCPYAGRCPHTMPICVAQMPALIDYAPHLGEQAPHLAACHWVEQKAVSGQLSAVSNGGALDLKANR